MEAVAVEAGNLPVKRLFDERKSKLSGNSIDEEQREEWLKQAVTHEEMEKIYITMADFEVILNSTCSIVYKYLLHIRTFILEKLSQVTFCITLSKS